MIQQLIWRMVDAGYTQNAAALEVLTADPLDLALHMEQVWSAAGHDVGPARQALLATGKFAAFAPPAGSRAWDHFGYSYALENTRAVQILRRVVRAFRSGETLGIPLPDTQRWLDATECMLFGAANPLSPWLSTSEVRRPAEDVRRNAYDRVFGVQLAFGTDDNQPSTYDRPNVSNAQFVHLFEELLYEVWQAISNVKNSAGVNSSDDDRIYRIAQELQFTLTSRRQQHLLDREELAAATALGWTELSFNANTPFIRDCGVTGTDEASRCKSLGLKLGLPAHGKSEAMFAMAPDLSLFLRAIESDVVKKGTAWVLYLDQPPPLSPLDSPTPIGEESRRLITEWAAATGKDLKVRAKPVDTARPRLVSVQ
jgi:hypothetical protein